MFSLSPKSTIATSGPPSAGSPTSRMPAGETWPTKSWSSQRGTARAASTAASGSTSPGAVTMRAQRAVGPQVAGEGAGVDAGDGRDAMRRAGATPAGRASRRRPRSRWPRRAPRSQGRIGLVVVDEAAVVADERVGHDHDLAGVRGVRADLLVAGLARVDDEVAAGARGAPRRRCRGRSLPSSRARSAGPRSPMRGIDDRAGARQRAARSRGMQRKEWVDRRSGTAVRTGAQGAAGSRDHRRTSLLSGLTGPVRRPHRTGRQGPRKGSMGGPPGRGPGRSGRGRRRSGRSSGSVVGSGSGLGAGSASASSSASASASGSAWASGAGSSRGAPARPGRWRVFVGVGARYLSSGDRCPASGTSGRRGRRSP